MNESKRLLNRYLFIGIPFVSVFILTGFGSDPVNVTKFLVLGPVAVVTFLLAIVWHREQLFSTHRLTLVFFGLFLLSMFSAVVQSEIPIEQNLYGEYGRNTGLLTYVFFILISVAVLTLNAKKEFNNLLKGLLAAGQINLVYCYWVLAFGDPINWNNQYGSLLGLLGNPNFIGAFLGMYITVALSVLAGTAERNTYFWLLLFSIPAAFYAVLETNAVQGLVVTAGGAALVCFFLIRSKFGSLVQSSYVLLVAIIGVIAILGTLQKGPFSFVYKRSVSLRGTYWNTGISMGLDHPLSGVGMDGYGDWYRRYRPEVALIDTPGPSVSSNAAHNIVLDFFSFGGFPLLISYLLILGLTLILGIKHISKTKKYEPTFVALFSVWLCYQVQSIISINQIGLAIWGWVLTAAVLAYVGSAGLTERKQVKRNANLGLIFPPSLLVTLGLVVGFFLSAPPISSDMNWFNAKNSNKLEIIQEALNPNYFRPESSIKYSQAVEIFAKSNLPVEAIKYARIAVKFHPNYFYAWRDLYFLSNSTLEEKQLAKENMKRLDPLNSEIDTLD